MWALIKCIEIYTHEANVVLEKMKDSNWAFTREVATGMNKIKKPSPEIEEIAGKFLLLLGQREQGWKFFQV